MKRSARRQCRCDRTTVRVSRRIWNRALSGSVTTGVRSLVIVVALLVAGCSTGSHIASGRPDGAPTRPAPDPPRGTPPFLGTSVSADSTSGADDDGGIVDVSAHRRREQHRAFHPRVWLPDA